MLAINSDDWEELYSMTFIGDFYYNPVLYLGTPLTYDYTNPGVFENYYYRNLDITIVRNVDT